MTSAASPSAQSNPAASASTTSGTTTPQSGAVPAQPPVRSYANATKTASSTPPAAAGASTSNAKSTESPINGTGPAVQGGSQPAINGVSTGAPSSSEHGRKPSMVISATGSSGYTQNGGPVGQTSRPPINFGSMNAPEGAQSNAAQQGQAEPAPVPQEGNRVIEPEHSPSPIPQPAASGGRPPSIAQGNGLNFGSMGGDIPGQAQGSLNAAGQHSHERRASSQSAYSEAGGPRSNFVPQAGRGRGAYPQAPYGQQMPSPAQNYRQMSNQPRAPGMAQQFSQGPQGSPYNRGRNSPAQPPAQPQMQYPPYPQHLGAAPPMYPGMPNQFDPYAGHYNPYPPYNYQYPGQGPPQSPRPQYPNAFAGTPGNSQPPFMPPNMARTSSQASDRPSSSLGHAATPSQSHAQTASSSTPQQTPQQGSSFVRPAKKSSAIKITNDRGEAVSFQKPSPSPSTQQAQTPVIVSTPNASTPPPRAPSSQHSRSESTSTMTAQEKQNAFKEQVKRQMEENKRKDEAESQPKETSAAATEAPAKPAAETEVKAATAEAEKAAAVAASDKEGAKDATAAATAVEDDEAEKKRKEQEEEDRLEREIAEMEAREKEEEEREKAYQAKKKAEKEAAAKVNAAKIDEELKKQEREAEERELQRERERSGETKKEETDDESKALFASLKKPTLGPGAEQSSESQAPAPAEPQPVANAAQAAQKPKPAHLKLETNKRVEPAEPTPGMQALKSSRFLEVKEDAKYPEGVKSPNPALNQNGTQKARAYDKDFLLQFQSVFKEKPTVDWDQKVKETLGGGDEPGSARPGSARSSSNMGGRQPSGRGPASNFGGAMGSFGSVPPGRTLPSGTTSEQRFALANAGGRPMGAPGSMGGRQPSGLGMGAPGMSRNSSMMGPGSPRQPSGRGKGGASRRGDRAPSKKELDDAANKMPLTAGMEVKPMEKTSNGWVARSLTQGAGASAPDPSGNMAPDMVQRKVKAALNKMTPEKFDRISDQILEIAGQSKNEADGRTLRQVIQLTFEKACDEAHWAGMYAKFCHKMLTTMSLEIRDETIKDKNGNPVVGGALFRKYLLNRCQEEFERGWEANLPEKPEGDESEIKLMSDEYYVAAAAKRRGLGLIQFIGQLYKLGMLTIRIMHECVQRLLNFEGDPDESAIENLTTLLRSVGTTMYESGDQGQALLNAYFERINEKITSNANLPSRPRFMVMDLIDLKNAGWRGKDDAKGPKTIQQIHAEAEAAQAKAEAEKQRQRAPGGRPMGGRGDSRNFSGNMPPPVDYSRTHVGADELRRLQNRTQSRNTGGGLGPGGNLGPGGGLGARAGSRRGLGPNSSGPSTRTSTPPVDNKKDEPTAQQNAFR